MGKQQLAAPRPAPRSACALRERPAAGTHTCGCEYQGLQNVRQGDNTHDAVCFVYYHQPMHLQTREVAPMSGLQKVLPTTGISKCVFHIVYKEYVPQIRDRNGVQNHERS